MPHVSVYMYPGRTDEQKKDLTKAIEDAVCKICNVTPDTVSVVIEEVAKDKWMQDVYEPLILAKKDFIYKRPGYGPLSN